MARKKTIKAKEPIKLWAKKLSNGNMSLYLKRYVPRTSGNRYDYECLGLYLVPEINKEARAKNKNILLIAEKIKADRISEILNGKAGIKKTIKAKRVLLVDWLKTYRNKKAKQGQSLSNAVTVNNVLMHLVRYKGDKITMDKVNKAFCVGFVLYLANCDIIERTNPNTGVHKKRPLAKNTAKLYYNTFVTALNEAVREGVLDVNPSDKLTKEEKKPINVPCNTRPYLSIEEVEVLTKTPCGREEVKAAFLFSCFCGLRYSDVVDLKWENVKKENGKWYIEKRQVKTRQTVIIPLSDEALRWMPKRTGVTDKDHVFDLPTPYTVNYNLKKWAKAANIDKPISYHVSRHTFGTLLVTLGADLYTTSKLMGHQNIRTTQIYAEIVNKKKEAAINLLDNIFKK